MNIVNIVLKAEHFRDPYAAKNVTLSPDGISNGHWMLRRANVDNASLFTSKVIAVAALKLGEDAVRETTATFASLCDKVPVRAWVATEFSVDGSDKSGPARIFRDGKGTLAAVSCAYLRVIDADSKGEVLWGSSPVMTFRDAEKVEDAAFLVMPVTLPKGLTITITSDKKETK